MKYTITYCAIEYGAGIFATPKPYKSEIIECDGPAKLAEYITSKSDTYGHKFKPNKSPRNVDEEYQYLSNTGGVKVSVYKPIVPKIKKI